MHSVAWNLLPHPSTRRYADPPPCFAGGLTTHEKKRTLCVNKDFGSSVQCFIPLRFPEYSISFICGSLILWWLTISWICIAHLAGVLHRNVFAIVIDLYIITWCPHTGQIMFLLIMLSPPCINFQYNNLLRFSLLLPWLLWTPDFPCRGGAVEKVSGSTTTFGHIDLGMNICSLSRILTLCSNDDLARFITWNYFHALRAAKFFEYPGWITAPRIPPGSRVKVCSRPWQTPLLNRASWVQ